MPSGMIAANIAAIRSAQESDSGSADGEAKATISHLRLCLN
jgi:hypothetical protein